MPYTTPSTLSDLQPLSAAWLNGISDNQEFLYSIGNQANIPFNGVRAVVETFGEANGVWSLRHRLRYFHYRILAESGNSPNYVHIYYGDLRIVHRTDTSFSFTGYADLQDPSAWFGYQGAWMTATGYDAGTAGGDIVTHGGEFYHCTANHTSGSTTEPGVGVDWETVWEVFGYTVGEFYQAYINLEFNDPGNQVTVEYLFEADTTTL